MNRFLECLVFVSVVSSAASASDPLPTVPQVPPPAVNSNDTVISALARSGRVLGSLRDRIGLATSSAQVSDSDKPVPAQPAAVEPVAMPAPCNGCGSSVIPGSPIKSWLFFRPSSGHELPWLRPHPYVGPITGQFPCSPTNLKCAESGGCAPAAAGCGRGPILGGRGVRGEGVCVPPAEDAFPGYKFAAPLAPRYGNLGPATTTSTSLKPAVSPTGAAAAAKSPTILESLKRSFGKQ